ncbi:glycosyltransferase family 39 protein [Lacinutrix algicola]|uniref:glycosyltransferase family 39 protein n=1 Tax=Lacinutrix algicola TaxID=342954 RepID=UPI0006E3714E|nr:glycosyltransferase family 39 protein [Lacinutrix algicola]
MLDFVKKISYKQVLFFLVTTLVFQFVLLKDLPFFWDGISKSVRASWIYNSNFTEWIVPTNINSGHPPLWILLLATFWTVFQKTLWSSRLLLLLVNIGAVWQLVLLCKTNFTKRVAPFLIFLVCLEPTFVAQTTSLNNDMLLLFFTLLAVNSILKNRLFFFTFAVTGLLFTNLRGMYILLAILLTHFAYIKYKLIEVKRSMYLGYLVSILLFSVFCALQYQKLGWFIISLNEGYNDHRQSVDFKQIIINTIVVLKCFLEYGRFIIYIILLPLVIKYLKNRKKNKSKEIDRLLLAFLIFVFVLLLGMIPFSNPIGDRYFMICYILSIVLLINLISMYIANKKTVVYCLITVFFVSGHFWVYPATISQSWDSSLAYLNYYKIESKMEDFITSQGIDKAKIGTRIRLNERFYSELKTAEDTKQYSTFNIDTNEYILLSNVENYTKDEELNHVKNNWKLIKEYSQLGVFVSLYKKP